MGKNEVLKQYFGHSEFRPGQGDIIDHILAGQDCLGVMPTGAGKSVCFQVPALMFSGTSIVISPLISLMKDQVEGLRQSGVNAAFINSSLDLWEYRQVLDDLVSIGTIGLIKAVNTFSVNRNIKLATYASRCIENEILMYLRKTSQRRCEISIDEPLNVDWGGNELLLSDVLGTDSDCVNARIEDETEKKLLHDAVNHLTPRERQIMEMRFGLKGGREKTQKEVADEIGISQSYISRLEKRIIKQLREELERVCN